MVDAREAAKAEAWRAYKQAPPSARYANEERMAFVVAFDAAWRLRGEADAEAVEPLVSEVKYRHLWNCGIAEALAAIRALDEGGQ